MRRALPIVVATLVGVFVSAPAWAQATLTWTGAAGPTAGNSYAFETAGNWSGNVAPVNGDNLLFGALPSINVNLANNFTAGNITFSVQNGLYLVGPATLTINGNASTTGGSNYWGLFELPVNLAAGNHTYTAGGNASIYHFAAISGSGGITKDGTNGLYLTESSTYSGGTIINTGTVYVGDNYALGYGTVTLNGGKLATAYADNDITLGNDFVFGASVSLDTSQFFDDQAPVTLTLGNGDGSSMTPAAGVTTVNFNLTGIKPVKFTGDLKNGGSATTYAFGQGAGSDGYHLDGFNTYTGGTLAKAGSIVVFESAGALPSSGSITGEPNSYVGIGEAGMESAFFSRINQASFAGTVGFENGETYTDNIDLSNFQQSSWVSIGTLSGAILTGAITPSSGPGGGYNFRSGGTLILNGSNPLTGSYGVLSSSVGDRPPGMVVLNQSVANTYSGNTVAAGGGIVFDGPSSLPASANLDLSNGGYVGVTDASGYTLADLVGKVGVVSNGGAIGYDSHSHIHSGTGATSTSAAIDFSSLSQDVYLGSATDTLVTGPIQTANGNTGDYFFTGFGNGNLSVGSLLSGNKAVHIGLPGVFQAPYIGSAHATVELSNGANAFTGGTILHSGYLKITDIHALGTGDIVVQADNSDGSAGLEAPSGNTLANDIILNSGKLHLKGNFTVSGDITGSGTIQVNNSMIFSGDNSFGGVVMGFAQLTAASNLALHNTSLELPRGGSVVFTSTAPQVGSLLQGDPDYSDGTTHATLELAATGTTDLTIDQTTDGYFYGSIIQNGSVGSVTKTGTGTLTITGNTNYGDTLYTGGTTIAAGTVIASGSGALGTGTITLDGGRLQVSPGVTLPNLITFGTLGGTLGGNTTFANALTVGPNAHLAPGDSPGTMTFTAGLTLAAGGTLDFEVQSALGAAGTGHDLLSISGAPLNVTATSGSRFTLKVISLNSAGAAGDVSDFSSANGYSWVFASSAAGITNFDADAFSIQTSSFSNSLNAGSFYVTRSGNNLILNFAPVPEPSIYALLALGLAGTALRMRRRRA